MEKKVKNTDIYLQDYNIGVWCLFFSMYKQSKYIMELEGERSFMYYLAEETIKIINGIMKFEIKIGLRKGEMELIDEHMPKRMLPVLNTRQLNPSITLLCSYIRLLDMEFPLMVKYFGIPQVYEFLEDMKERVMSPESKIKDIPRMYQEALTAISAIINPLGKPSIRVVCKMRTFKAEFKDLLENHYPKVNDSHGIEHCEDVIAKAVEYVIRFNIKDVDEDEIIMVGYFHDMFSHSDRKNHHTKAADWVRFSINPMFGDKVKKERIAMAIQQHRASENITEYHSPLAEVMASADRGDMSDVNIILTRSYRYTLEKNKEELNKLSSNPRNKLALKMVLAHMVDKFSRTGYMTYPSYFKRRYDTEIIRLHLTIDELEKGTKKLTLVNNRVIVK